VQTMRGPNAGTAIRGVVYFDVSAESSG
jgi:hypothetical protein